MKITIVCGFFLPVPPVAGGALEKMWWRLSRIFARRGHEVTLISRCWPGWPDQEIIEGVKLVRVPGFDHRARLWQNLLLDGIWGLRVLWVLPSADILVTNTVALPVFVRQLRSRAGTLVVNLNRFPKGQVRWYGRAARIQAASRIIAQAAIRQAPARAAIIRVTPNPVDCTLFAGPVPSRDHDAALTIGYIGRINPEKGLLTLINAAVILAGTTDLPPWRIVLRGPVDVPRGGGGEAFAHALRTMAPRLWDEQRIVLSPPLFDPVALAQSYGELDVFCYPTEADEGEAHPVAVLEAMAAGRPVVATDLPCFADQVVTEQNALLVPPRDPTALATALARLLREPDLRARLGRSAREAIWALDDQSVATQHLADFAQLLHESRS